MFQSGMTVEEIAAERELNPQTIHGHLATSIEKGQLSFKAVSDMDDELSENIKTAVEASRKDGFSLKAVYEALGGRVDYHLLRYWLAREQVQS